MTQRKDQVSLMIEPLRPDEMGRGTHLPPERLESIRRETLRLVSIGYTQAQVAAALGVGTSRISRWCRTVVMETRAPLRLLSFTDRTLPQMLWDRIGFSDQNECWEWLGFVKSNGYGSLNYKGKTYQAHRAVYENFVGTIPGGMVIDHMCANKSCVNPRHLQPVTQTENLMLAGRRISNG